MSSCIITSNICTEYFMNTSETALLNFFSEYFIVWEYDNFKFLSLYIYVEYIFRIFYCTCFFIWNFCSEYLKRILHLNIG